MIFSLVYAAGVLGQGDAAVIGSLLASLTAIAVCWLQGVKTRGAVTTDVMARLDILDTKFDAVIGRDVDFDVRLKSLERNARWE